MFTVRLILNFSTALFHKNTSAVLGNIYPSINNFFNSLLRHHHIAVEGGFYIPVMTSRQKYPYGFKMLSEMGKRHINARLSSFCLSLTRNKTLIYRYYDKYIIINCFITLGTKFFNNNEDKNRFISN